MMALIYTLSATLLAGLLGAYLYFSVIQQQSPNSANSSSANLALLLFVNAVLVFSLILIWLENIPDDTPLSPLEKYIAEVKANEKADKTETDTERLDSVIQTLNQISQSISLTNKTLNLGLERLSSRIDDIENNSIDKIMNTEKICSSEEFQPELKKIFNDELAKTLSGLEIMQDNNDNNIMAKKRKV